MGIRVLLLTVTAALILHPITALRSYYIVPSDNSDCNLSMYEACFTLQQFAERVQNNSARYFQENISLSFAPGKHILLGGIELRNTASVDIRGQANNSGKPEVSCTEGNCFSFKNSSKVHLENLAFIECFNDNSNGGAISVSESDTVNITQCTFTNNIVLKQGGAVRLELVETVHMLQNQFLNNSAFCNQSQVDICSPNCTASGGALSVMNVSSLVVSDLYFERNTASCRGGAVDLSFSAINLSNSNFVRNSVTAESDAERGGGLFLVDSILNLVESTFEGNSAFNGGGIFSLNSTLDITKSIFSRNTAHRTLGGGGAIVASFSDISLMGCSYLNNIAGLYGGAVSVSDGMFFSKLSSYEANFVHQQGGAVSLVQSQANFSGDVFLNNTASLGAGASIFQTDNNIQIHNTSFANNLASGSEGPLYSLQLENVRGDCEGISVINNTGSVYLFYSTLSFSGTITFTNNNGLTGAGLTLVQSTASFRDSPNITITSNSATFGGGIFLSQSVLNIYTPMTITRNTAFVGGGVFCYQSQVSFNVEDMSSPVLFADNSGTRGGGAIQAIATNLNFFRGSMIFTRNQARRGGAIVLSQGSKLYIQKIVQERLNTLSVEVIFSENSAFQGGVLFIADNTNSGILCHQSTRNPVQSIATEECFIQTLRLYYPRNTNYDQFNYMNIFFNSNKATAAGSIIYGGLLDRCQINAISEINNFDSVRNNVQLNGFDYLKMIAQFQDSFVYNQTSQSFDPLYFVDAITSKHVKGLITSEPVQLCFCVNNNYDCSYQWPTISVKRGEAFTIEAVAVDQVKNPINGTVEASVLSGYEGTFKAGQVRQTINGTCSKLTYNIFSTRNSFYFELYSDGPCTNVGISTKQVFVTFLPCDCPNGLQPAPLDNECRCECDSTLELYIQSCQLNSNNVSLIRRNEDYWIQYLGFGNESRSGFLVQLCPNDYCVDMSIDRIELPQNVDQQCAYNRTGLLCGECEEGLSLVFGSSRCIQCSNNYLALLIAFAVAGVALVAFILILNLTVAVGTLHGLILYANIVAANGSVFLPSDTALRFFVSWVNLDLGIETCFYNGMDSYAKVLLQLAFPIFIILLSLLIIIISSCWDWFAGLIGPKNPIATLCTLFLLSYSKLLRTTIASLQSAYLTYPDGSTEIRWFYNPSIPYFATSRIPFFLVAFIIVIFGSIYTILLFFGQWLRKIPGNKLVCCAQNSKYNAFIDAYHAPFVVKYRYWMGILLLTRIIHHLLTALVEESVYLLLVSTLMCALLILNKLMGKVYKNWLIGFLETSYIINLLLFSVSTYYVTNNNGNQVALANTSTSIAFITFLAIAIFHAHTYFLKNVKLYLKLLSGIAKCVKHLKKKTTKSADSTSSTNTVESTEYATNYSVSSLNLHLLREPALDVIAPITKEDYKEYSPPPVASAPPCPVIPTSTTVGLDTCTD